MYLEGACLGADGVGFLVFEECKHMLRYVAINVYLDILSSVSSAI